MTELDQQWLARAEEVVCSLAGVRGAHIRVEGGRIGAIFVEADATRDVRKIVRDVEAIMATQFGLEIDYRKVSVATTEGEPRERRLPARRLTFESVRVETADLETRARVELALGDAHVLGIAGGPATRASAYDLAAEACLRAAHRFVVEPVAFALSGVERVRIAREEVLVVTVRIIQGRQEKVLTGACPLEQDDLRTVVYATLDAINRVFEQLELRELVEYVLGSGEESTPAPAVAS
jgi:hypothetical protein